MSDPQDVGTPHRDVFNFLMTRPGWWLIAGVAILIATVAGAAYKIGNDLGKASADAYEAANKMKLAQLTNQALEASAKLREASTDFIELVKASETAKTLTAENGKLKSELQQVNDKLTQVEQQLTDASEKLSVANNEIARLSPKDQIVVINANSAEYYMQGNIFAVVKIYHGSGWILAVNDKDYIVDRGSTVVLDGLLGARCTLRVKQYVYSVPGLEIAASCV